MSYYPLVADDFKVPERLETDRFVVVPLIMDRFAIDYESYNDPERNAFFKVPPEIAMARG